MDTFKKIMRFLSSLLFYTLMFILVVVVVMVIAYFVDQKIGQSKGEQRNPLFGAYVIISNSMVPNINVHDAVVTVRTTEKHIAVNDIITFISKEIETAGTPITHRVVGIVYDTDDEDKILGYRTKGDNNASQDFAIIKPEEVIGKVYLRIPLIGYVQTIMTKPIGWVLIVIIPCLFIIGKDVFKLIKVTKADPDTSEPIDDSKIIQPSSPVITNNDQTNSTEDSTTKTDNDTIL